MFIFSCCVFYGFNLRQEEEEQIMRSRILIPRVTIHHKKELHGSFLENHTKNYVSYNYSELTFEFQNQHGYSSARLPYIYFDASWENLLKHQNLLFLVIISFYSHGQCLIK